MPESPLVTSVTELGDGRSGEFNGSYQGIYARSFEVVTVDPAVGFKVIRQDSRLPQMGQYYTNGETPATTYYEEDLGSFVNNVKGELLGMAEGGGIAWKVTVQYGPGNTAEFTGDPTLWKMRVRFGGERTERVVDFDRYGNPMMNSAGDRFADPVTVPDHISTMIITRNELVSTFSLSLASAYSDTRNLYSWNGFGAGYCLMGIIETSEEKYDASTNRWYYTVTYPVQIGRTPWMKRLLDQGFNELDAYGHSKPIMTGGQPVSDPRPLDGAGHELDGTTGYSDPVILPFDVYDEVDWTGLGINLSLRLGV